MDIQRSNAVALHILDELIHLLVDIASASYGLYRNGLPRILCPPHRLQNKCVLQRLDVAIVYITVPTRSR